MELKGKSPDRLYPENWDADETGWGHLSEKDKQNVLECFENLKPKVDPNLPVHRFIVFGTGGNLENNSTKSFRDMFYSNDMDK